LTSLVGSPAEGPEGPGARPPAEAPGAAGAGSLGELLTITLVVSACSLLYELLIAQTLSLHAGNTVIWYSLTVGAYLGAMGLGAVLLPPRSGGSDWNRLFVVEVLLSVVGAAAVLVIEITHSVHLFFFSPGEESISLSVFFAASMAMTVLVGLLSGVELPLLIRIGSDVAPGTRPTNRVLGWDYIGALAAGVLFPLGLVPYLSMHVIGFATAMVNVLVAAYVLRRFVARDTWMAERTVAVAALGALLLVGIAQGSDIQQYFLKRYYFHYQASERGSIFGGLDDLPDVRRVFSPYQNIDLVYDPDGYPTDVLLPLYSTKWRDDPDFPKDRFLFLNGDFQFSSSHEESYHEWFAHVPVILNGEPPERVLVMGAGDGLLMRELVKYSSIRSITHVDLDRRLVDLARTDSLFRVMNRGALDDPRIESHFGDAFQYLRTSSRLYDAIYLDFPYAKDYNVAKLYSREFFHFVYEHLADDGFAVLDAPGASYFGLVDESGHMALVPGGEWEIYYNTMRAAGFDDVVPFRSTVEPDNPDAIAFLQDWSGTPDFRDPRTGQPHPEIRAEWIRRTVALHRNFYREGFMIMWKGEAPPTRYRDPGVELSMLDERRFGLSFPPRFDRESDIDSRWVNSILRPTLPTTGVWYVRHPWN